jgi:PII-like signaling protein
MLGGLVMSVKGKLLKIYLGESDHCHGEPMYHTIIKKIRELGLAGATVTRGIEGYGAGSRIHSTRILSLSEDLPIVIEVVDFEEKLNALVEVLEGMIKTGVMITMQDVDIVRFTK